ncbi:MAG TPA: C10 family peptidase [Bacteroidales bacterium]|nr:C10 family peptidase [Bacteroidales bacterium]
MKKIYLTFAFLFLGLALIADPVSIESAQKIALNYFKHFVSGKADYNISNVITKQNNGTNTFYVFNFSAGGYIIVSADDAALPVLGYSEDGTYIENNLPVQMVEWLADYDAEIKYIIDQDLSNKQTVKEWSKIINNELPSLKLVVAPLCATTWNQDCYYNQLCPSATGGPCSKVYAGCVATAMAQIMKKWNWPVTGTASHSYTHATYGTLSANFGTTNYDWTNMPNNLVSGSTTVQKTAVATLIYHCGVSVDMDYDPSGSGAYSQIVPNALMNYFGYKNTVQDVYLANYTTTAWRNLLITELDAGRPIQYSGSTGSMGHAFVCDGYNASNQFHFNWGWSGYDNGYFAIGALNPTGYQFNQSNMAIIGIEPANSPSAWVLQNTGFTTQSRGIDQIFIVDPNVVWAKAYDGSGNAVVVREFTKTTNGGTTWTPGTITFTGSTSYGVSNIHAFSSTTAYACMYPTSGTGGKIVKTTNGGTSWAVLSDADAAFPGSWANFVHFFNTNDGIAMGDPTSSGGDFYIITTADGGTTWSVVGAGNIPNALAGEAGVVNQFDAVGNTIWFGTTYGRMFKSADKGLTWSVANVSQAANYQVTPVFKDATNGIAVLTNYSTGDHIGTYKTTSGGTSWTVINPTGFYVKNPNLDYVPGTANMYVDVTPGSGNGSSYSLDGCMSFLNIDTGSVQYTTVKFYDINTGWAGGYNLSSTSGGIFKWQNALLVGTEEQAVKQDEILVYPNPTSGMVNIEFPVFFPGIANISVYNLLGEKIIEKEFDPSFDMILPLDLSDNIPGIYLITVQTGNGITSKRVMLAR